MTRLVRLVAMILLIQVASVSAAWAFDHSKVAQRALRDHIRPGYSRLQEAATVLKDQVGKLCT
ncbi:MAG: hypothetical protein AAGK01_03200, partial [Pseudomonadota bacterium]